MTATKAPNRRVELTHEEGASYLPPDSVLVYGHDIDEDAARIEAQSALDEWATEYGDDTPTPQRRLVTTGRKTHVRLVPRSDEGWSEFHFDAKPGRGASAIWLFGVDDHLKPRCTVEGCELPGGYYGIWAPERASFCTQHSRMFRAQYDLQVAERSLHSGWVLGRPEADDYFGRMTTQERRDIALRDIDSAADRFADTAKRVAETMRELESAGFTWPVTLADGASYVAWAPFNPATSPLYYFSQHETENEHSRGTIHVIGGSATRIEHGLNDALCGWKVPKGRSSLRPEEIKVGRVCERCAKALGSHAWRVVTGR